ncbi:MAG: (2Fe-2S)-binding protein [Myxococcales bacterium]|nr:(2Fe-2S)-binding protein [Myxococcales bacterium]
MPWPGPEPAAGTTAVAAAGAADGGALVPIALTVNGDRVTVAVPPARTLVELLREVLGLVGTKQGCDAGDCGACTVLVDDEPVLSCLTLAVAVDGRRIETVEALARGGRLAPLQEAFVRHGAAQCGFCTPGMLMTASALLRRTARPDRDEVRHALAGNLCRCTGYVKIVDAVVAAGEASAAPAAGEASAAPAAGEDPR